MKTYGRQHLTVHVNYGTPHPGSGVVGRFDAINKPGACVTVDRGGQTTFTLPKGVADYNFGKGTSHVRAPDGVTVTRVDNGRDSTFTVKSQR
jgi:hypothetical protein